MATSLDAMPEHLRAGVIAESIFVAALLRVSARMVRRPTDQQIAHVLGWLGRSPIALLRQYPRLLRSLVVFAECEAADELSPA